MAAVVYLVPCVLDDTATHTIPHYIIEAVKNCQVIFAENERTARRFLKSICKEIVIDNYEWFAIHKAETEVLQSFKNKLKEEKTIAIISEAGCPGTISRRNSAPWIGPKIWTPSGMSASRFTTEQTNRTR